MWGGSSQAAPKSWRPCCGRPTDSFTPFIPVKSINTVDLIFPQTWKQGRKAHTKYSIFWTNPCALPSPLSPSNFNVRFLNQVSQIQSQIPGGRLNFDLSCLLCMLPLWETCFVCLSPLKVFNSLLLLSALLWLPTHPETLILSSALCTLYPL